MVVVYHCFSEVSYAFVHVALLDCDSFVHGQFHHFSSHLSLLSGW